MMLMAGFNGLLRGQPGVQIGWKMDLEKRWVDKSLESSVAIELCRALKSWSSILGEDIINSWGIYLVCT